MRQTHLIQTEPRWQTKGPGNGFLPISTFLQTFLPKSLMEWVNLCSLLCLPICHNRWGKGSGSGLW